MTKKKKTIVRKEDNTRAQRLFLIFVGILIWFSVIGSAVYIRKLIENSIEIYLIITAILQFMITIMLILGIWGLINQKRPFHYFILIGTLLNIVFSIFEPIVNILQLSISILILYLGIRFPISMDMKNNDRSLK